ncbi:hypothetical protein SCUCBS95973_008622 [Sporothrix curviconia]|uniref:Peptidase S54 rhomboid domain-containing protein n=1 Tax=Sporothrix curviconia TaxID=1260050 RepID=A0ABP0CQ81_9PEZI
MSSLRGGLRSALRPPVCARAAPFEHGLSMSNSNRLPPAAASASTQCTASRPLPPWPSVQQKRLFCRAASRAACHSRPCLRSSSSVLASATSRATPGKTTQLLSRPLSRGFFSGSVVTAYVDLPPGYDDADGLDFRRRGNLEPSEVAAVFGPGMSPDAANTLLRILHGRRVAGTLDDPALRANTARFPKSAIDTALAYLRKTTPVDELINAGLRAEDELAMIEREQAEWMAKNGLAAAPEAGDAGEVANTNTAENGTQGPPSPPPTTTESKWQARLFRDVPKDDVYGVGAFDVIRARNRAKNEVRERKRRAADEARRAAQEKEWAEMASKSRELVGPGGAQTTTVLGMPREMSPRMQQYALAATSALEAPPTMSRWQRLWPSYATVLALLVGGGVVVSSMAAVSSSSPSSSSAASALSPSAATVFALIGANIAVFAAWRLPPLWRLLNRYMIVVPATPRPLSLLGAMFSHQKASHLLANCLFLWFIGIRLHDEIGRPAFLQVYFSSGLLAFLASMTNIVLRNNLHLTTLGASGAIYGIATAYFMLHKFEGFKILDLPPDPYRGIQGLGFIGLMLGLNLLTLRAEKQAIDVATHFAGMAVGAAFGEYMRVQREEAARAVAQGRPPRSVWQVALSPSPERPVQDPEAKP